LTSTPFLTNLVQDLASNCFTGPTHYYMLFLALFHIELGHILSSSPLILISILDIYASNIYR